jgi:hypothetical protein
MNSLEMQLRSWEPRPPSASLKQRLFPARVQARPPAPPLAWRWLAPALTCVLLAVVVVNQETGVAPRRSRPEPIVAVASSNHSSAASLSNDIKRAGSALPGGSYEWTNRSDLASNYNSFLPVKLN